MTDVSPEQAWALAAAVKPYDAIVVASTRPWLTVVHEPWQAALVNEAIHNNGLRAERIDERRVKVFGRD